jgi:hypothetical protein
MEMLLEVEEEIEKLFEEIHAGRGGRDDEECPPGMGFFNPPLAFAVTLPEQDVA